MKPPDIGGFLFIDARRIAGYSTAKSVDSRDSGFPEFNHPAEEGELLLRIPLRLNKGRSFLF